MKRSQKEQKKHSKLDMGVGYDTATVAIFYPSECCFNVNCTLHLKNVLITII